jgi:hypothetical protein
MSWIPPTVAAVALVFQIVALVFQIRLVARLEREDRRLRRVLWQMRERRRRAP